jgi:hypothetical protein
MDETRRLAPQAPSSRRPMVDSIFTFHAAAYNLVRLRQLLAQPI